jgi:hypothetical protein
VTRSKVSSEKLQKNKPVLYRKGAKDAEKILKSGGVLVSLRSLRLCGENISSVFIFGLNRIVLQ